MQMARQGRRGRLIGAGQKVSPAPIAVGLPGVGLRQVRGTEKMAPIPIRTYSSLERHSRAIPPTDGHKLHLRLEAHLIDQPPLIHLHPLQAPSSLSPLLQYQPPLPLLHDCIHRPKHHRPPPQKHHHPLNGRAPFAPCSIPYITCIATPVRPSARQQSEQQPCLRQPHRLR